MNFDQIEQTLRIAVDPCERKHKGNPESVEAHKRVRHTKEETYRAILDYVRSVGGATSKEIARALGYGEAINKISGRLSELKSGPHQRLKKSGVVREGSAELVIS